MATEHYDIVIIGSGAGGGTLAWKLAPTGKRILLLERGDYLPRERDNWETDAVFLHAKYTTDETWKDADGDDFIPEQNYNVGGNTTHREPVLVQAAILVVSDRLVSPRGSGSTRTVGNTAPTTRL